MGTVYRARDDRLERDVALRILSADALSDESARKSFRTEALALSRLNHPHIATVHDFDSEAGPTFLGISLDRVALSTRARFPGQVELTRECGSRGSLPRSTHTGAHGRSCPKRWSPGCRKGPRTLRRRM